MPSVLVVQGATIRPFETSEVGLVRTGRKRRDLLQIVKAQPQEMLIRPFFVKSIDLYSLLHWPVVCMLLREGV